jgi:uncharacterized protein YdeI (YjbR/CyaY-like superfamily)
METNTRVENYILKKEKWVKELELLRSTVLNLGLEETIKWGAPVYVDEGKNIVGFAAFKSYVGLWFFQGALIKDIEGKLINAQEGKTTAMRQWRFESFNGIVDELDQIAIYISEAVENSRSGREIKPNRNKSILVPEELQKVLDEDKLLNESFEKLSLGKKREYTEHISAAKRVQTKQSRVEKVIPMILEGVGLHDKYKKK